AILCRTTRTHLATSQIENARAIPVLCHLQQRAAAGLLHVVAMGGDGQDIQSALRGRHRGRIQSRFPCSRTTFSRTIRRWEAISFKVGSTRFTCSSVSTKIRTTGSLPPASTRWVVSTL